MKKQGPKPGKLKLLNPTKEPLTKDKLRELSGLELNDQEAENTVHSIHLFAKLLFSFLRRKRTTCIDNQEVVNLNTQTKKAV